LLIKEKNCVLPFPAGLGFWAMCSTLSGSACLFLDTYRSVKERKIEPQFKWEGTSGSHLIKLPQKTIRPGHHSKLDLNLKSDCVDQSLIQSSSEYLQEWRFCKLFN